MLCAYINRQVHTDTGPGMHGCTRAHTRTDKHSLACRQVGPDLDGAGKQTHRQLGIPGSRKAALGLCLYTRPDGPGTRSSSRPAPAPGALRQPPPPAPRLSWQVSCCRPLHPQAPL